MLWAYAHAQRVDARKMERDHEMRKMALARYGRQSLLQWEHVSASEIRDYYDLLVDLVRHEGSPTEDL